MGKLVGIARATRVRTDMEELDTVSVTAEAGLEDDRRGRVEGRQVTVFAREAWSSACTDLGVSLPWTTRRANLLVEGVELPRSVGDEFAIGTVRLKVMEETAPCSMMEKAHVGLRETLSPDWRGGVSCNVIEGGMLNIGDCVTV